MLRCRMRLRMESPARRSRRAGRFRQDVAHGRQHCFAILDYRYCNLSDIEVTGGRRFRRHGPFVRADGQSCHPAAVARPGDRECLTKTRQCGP